MSYFLHKNYKLQKESSEVFYKKGDLKNFASFTRRHQCWSLFSIKLQTWEPETLLNWDSNTAVSCEICEKDTFFWGTSASANDCFCYYFLHELRVTFYIRVTIYYLLHEYVRVTSYFLLHELGLQCWLCKGSLLYQLFISTRCLSVASQLFLSNVFHEWVFQR